MTMRQVLWSGVGLALGLTSLSANAQDKREVIATSSPAPVATLGTPMVGSPIKVRAQMDDKPIAPPSSIAPPLSSDAAVPVLPQPSFMPPAGQPIESPIVGTPIGGPVHDSSPHPDSWPHFMGMLTWLDPASPPSTCGVFCAPGRVDNRWYVSGEYLFWWTRPGGLPPLVTTGSPESATVIESGTLDRRIDPATRVLYGNSSIDTQGRSGARFEVGRWFGDCKPWAIEFGGFFLGQQDTNFHINSTQVTPLSRPIIVANIPREGVDNFAQPGILAGSIDINTSTNFYGANIDWRRRLWCGCRWNLDGTLGFRYLNLDESLNITERSEVIADRVFAPNLNNTPVPRGLQNIITDRFHVDNDFYGGMMGLNGSYHCNRFSFDMGAKCSTFFSSTSRTSSYSTSKCPGSMASPPCSACRSPRTRLA